VRAFAARRGAIRENESQKGEEIRGKETSLPDVGGGQEVKFWGWGSKKNSSQPSEPKKKWKKHPKVVP